MSSVVWHADHGRWPHGLRLARSTPRGSAPVSRIAALSRYVLLVFGVLWVLGTVAGQWHALLGFDAHAYWSAWRHGVYSAGPQQKDAFLYSPAFAEATWPLTLLPWAVFLVGWTALNACIFAWLVWPMGRMGIVAFAFCVPAILIGNVWAILALVMVLGFRRPGWWAFPLLTKITPAVGIVWFAARREWRQAGVAVGVGLGIALVSVALAPALWASWAHLLLHPAAASSPGHAVRGGLSFVPLALRLPVAIGLTVWAARADRRWVLPIAGGLATPVFGIVSLSVCAAIPRLRGAHAPARVARGARPAQVLEARRETSLAEALPAPL
ncbi:MAG: glycosyltransferase family 87 protein [Gaiellales bacterium]